MLDSFYLAPNAVTGPDPLGILLVAVIAYFCGCFNGAVIVSKSVSYTHLTLPTNSRV